MARCKKCGCTPEGHNALRDLADHVVRTLEENSTAQGLRELSDAARAAVALSKDEGTALFEP